MPDLLEGERTGGKEISLEEDCGGDADEGLFEVGGMFVDFGLAAEFSEESRNATPPAVELQAPQARASPAVSNCKSTVN